MKPNRLIPLLLALMLIVLSAQAETYYVYTANGKSLNMRSAENNAVIGNIPNGTMLETDDLRSNETAAYVTWGGKSGFVKWQFLRKEPPASKGSVQTASPAVQKPETVRMDNMLPTNGEGDVTIQAYGAYIEYTSKNSGKYSAVSFDKPVKVKVTADLPKGKTIDYWVIDGVRYDFKSKIPNSFTLDNVTDSMIVEAVAKGQSSQTILSASTIQEIRTGETLIVNTIHAKLCHVRDDLKGAGGWITSFDFTNDYSNRATKQWEDGGQVTVRVKATIPKGKKISYWKFNDVKIDFDKNVTEMIVHTLNVSKTYEPVFGKTTTKKQGDPPTREDPAMYTVTCVNCVFSGGGYNNATSGTVPAGTRVTVTAKVTEVSHWRINGSVLTKAVNKIVDGKKQPVKVDVNSSTISRDINKNTKFECFSVIN